MGVANGHVAAFHDDQLVTGLQDVDFLTAKLGKLGVGVGHVDMHKGLGLALISGLTGIDRAIGALRLEPAVDRELAALAAERATEPGMPPAAPLDLLLSGLRTQFRTQYRDWEPVLGKNRTIAQIAGSPHIGGGSTGDPEPASRPLTPRSHRTEHGHGIRVGLLDTRIFPAQWLAGGYLALPADLIDPGEHLKASQGHGTAVASLVLSRAPAASIYLRRVLSDYTAADAWTAAKAMADAADEDFDVVNLSFGEYFTDDGHPPLVLAQAVRMLSARGTVVVAAAGNHGNVSKLKPDLVPAGLAENSPSYPAALPGVVAVGALDRGGAPAGFTPKHAPWISLMAPGTDLTVAYLDGDVLIEHKDIRGAIISKLTRNFTGWATWSGTSLAAAIVTGEIAARTIRGRNTARQALDTLLHPRSDQPRNEIRPHAPEGCHELNSNGNGNGNGGGDSQASHAG